MKVKYEESELRRNHLTVRLKDCEHQAITHQAWLAHQTASGFLRSVALDYLEMSNVDLNNPLNDGVVN